MEQCEYVSETKPAGLASGLHGGRVGDSDVPHISGWSWYLLRWGSLGKGGSGLEDKTRADLLSGMHYEGQIWGRQQAQDREPSFRLMMRRSRAGTMWMWEKSTSLLNKPTKCSGCLPQVAEQADQRENTEVKPQYGDDGRQVKGKLGHERDQDEAAAT